MGDDGRPAGMVTRERLSVWTLAPGSAVVPQAGRGDGEAGAVRPLRRQ